MIEYTRKPMTQRSMIYIERSDYLRKSLIQSSYVYTSRPYLFKINSMEFSVRFKSDLCRILGSIVSLFIRIICSENGIYDIKFIGYLIIALCFSYSRDIVFKLIFYRHGVRCNDYSQAAEKSVHSKVGQRKIGPALYHVTRKIYII